MSSTNPETPQERYDATGTVRTAPSEQQVRPPDMKAEEKGGKFDHSEPMAEGKGRESMVANNETRRVGRYVCDIAGEGGFTGL